MESKDFEFVTSLFERSDRCRCEEINGAFQIQLRLDDNQI